MQARSNIIFGKRAYDRATVYCRSRKRELCWYLGPKFLYL